MEKQKLANPAVVGLAGFGLTTLLLQVHNLGFLGLGPVLAMGFIFGGLAQFIAGFMEQKVGNNFGFCAFVSYGAFWIGLGIIWICNHFELFVSSHTDVGFYLVAWTLLSLILWIASMWIHRAMFVTFTLLIVGFIGLDLGHFGFPVMNQVAAVVLICCAFGAWYMMASVVINDVAGRTILPLGPAVLQTGEKRAEMSKSEPYSTALAS